MLVCTLFKSGHTKQTNQLFKGCSVCFVCFLIQKIMEIQDFFPIPIPHNGYYAVLGFGWYCNHGGYNILQIRKRMGECGMKRKVKALLALALTLALVSTTLGDNWLYVSAENAAGAEEQTDETTVAAEEETEEKPAAAVEDEPAAPEETTPVEETAPVEEKTAPAETVPDEKQTEEQKPETTEAPAEQPTEAPAETPVMEDDQKQRATVDGFAVRVKGNAGSNPYTAPSEWAGDTGIVDEYSDADIESYDSWGDLFEGITATGGSGSSSKNNSSNKTGPGQTLNGWVGSGEKWYYYNNGQTVKGWVNDGGTWYYCNPTTGLMETGWAIVNFKTYYLNPNHGGPFGAMVTGTQTIDGKTYNFAASGEVM